MTTLIPTRYSEKDNSTFFEALGLLITVGYQVDRRSRLLVLPGAVVARIEAKIGDSLPPIGHEYEIPRSLRVGGEIAQVERGLYGFMDEVVRAAVQVKTLESTERAVEAAETEHLFLGGELEDSDVSGRRESGSRNVQLESGFVAELAERVITAVRHLTNVTSLTREGLETYQSDRSHALAEVLESTSLSSSVRMQGVLQAVEAFLHFEVESTTDVEVLRGRTIEYLDEVNRRREPGTPRITERQTQIVANEFVPAYVEMKVKYDAAVGFPRDVIGHAFGSFIGGGIAGFFALSVFGEAVIRGVTGIYVDIPGFYIGAGIAFVTPFIKGIHGVLTRDKRLERRREALLRKVGSRMELALPGKV
jgi:Arc/MetJ-type ribon-helix-helix transcriptional regulator